MRLTIDTQHDSKEEIRKAIKLLVGIVGHEVYSNDPQISTPSAPSLEPSPQMSNMMSMFDTPAASPAPEPEKDENIPQLEFY